MDKRGLSSIVTSLLIIVVVFIAVGLVWVVVKNVLDTGLEGIDLDKTTTKLDVKQVSILGENVTIKVERGSQGGEIVKVKFVLSNESGSSDTIEKEIQINKLEQKTILLENTGIANVSSVIVVPIIKSGEKEVAAVENEYNVGTGTSSSGDSGGSSCTDGDNDGTCVDLDCNDADANVWQLLTGHNDSDGDSYYSVGSGMRGTYPLKCGARCGGLSLNHGYHHAPRGPILLYLQ